MFAERIRAQTGLSLAASGESGWLWPGGGPRLGGAWWARSGSAQWSPRDRKPLSRRGGGFGTSIAAPPGIPAPRPPASALAFGVPQFPVGSAPGPPFPGTGRRCQNGWGRRAVARAERRGEWLWVPRRGLSGSAGPARAQREKAGAGAAAEVGGGCARGRLRGGPGRRAGLTGGRGPGRAGRGAFKPGGCGRDAPPRAPRPRRPPSRAAGAAGRMRSSLAPGVWFLRTFSRDSW